jgi:uncharacterized protein (UPF0332 family)
LTKDNRRRNIALELAHGTEAFRAAELLLGAGLFRDAVSRAYYGAFHFACALLLSAGEEARTHGGVDRMLQRDFVRAGKLTPEMGMVFASLQRFRQAADYSSEFVFTEAGAKKEVEDARAFMAAVRALLDAEGWLPEA